MPRIERCPACLQEWSADGEIRLPVDGLADVMLSGALRTRLPELVYERCGGCGSLIATDDRRDAELLNELYRGLPDAYWDGLNSHVGFGRVLDRYLAPRRVAGDLWDIGCGSGTLLQNLKPEWRKHGIEPGLNAVAVARRRGFDVLEGTAATLRLEQVADAALLVDVVEHLPDPRVELEAAWRMLRPGGVFGVFTGAADARTARFAADRWYYLRCVGHVTIFSRRALRELLTRVGFVEVETHRVEHPGGVSLARWARRILGNALRGWTGRRPAAMNYYHDHQLVIASRPS